jgi:hypothetical protein
MNDLGATEYDGCAVLARISIRLEPVAAAKGGEKTPVPLIDELEIGFYRLLDLLRGSQCLPHPFDGRSRRVTFSSGRGSFEQRGDLAQFLAEFLFCGHGYNFLVEGGSRKTRMGTGKVYRPMPVPHHCQTAKSKSIQSFLTHPTCTPQGVGHSRFGHPTRKVQRDQRFTKTLAVSVGGNRNRGSL